MLVPDALTLLGLIAIIWLMLVVALNLAVRKTLSVMSYSQFKTPDEILAEYRERYRPIIFTLDPTTLGKVLVRLEDRKIVVGRDRMSEEGVREYCLAFNIRRRRRWRRIPEERLDEKIRPA